MTPVSVESTIASGEPPVSCADPPGAADEVGLAPPLPIRQFSRSLPMAMLRAREAVMRRFRRMLAGHGVTEQQWRTLRALAEAGEISVTELATRTELLMPSLSRILRDLERRALVSRRSRAGDQRQALMRVSPGGLDLIRRVAPDAEACYAEITAAFGERRLSELQGLLDALTESLDREVR